ncbi:MAG: hypothetical protein QOD38_1479 [Acidimicrobiaceae bacterium]
MPDDEARERVERERKKARDEDRADKEQAARTARAKQTAEEVADLAVGSTDPPAEDVNVGWMPATEREEEQAGRTIGEVGNILAPDPPPPPPASPTASPEPPAAPSLSEIADQARAGRGCLSGFGIPAAAILLVLAAAIGVIVLSGGDDKPSTTAAGGPQGGNGPLASFAGHFVMVEGLDDPAGLDAGAPGGRQPGSAGSSGATIDIDSNGTITGGSYHAFAENMGCRFTADGSTAKGNATAAGTGSVIFDTAQTEGGEKCADFSYPGGHAFEFGISGDDLYLCRSHMATLTTCSAEYPRLAGRFHRG